MGRWAWLFAVALAAVVAVVVLRCPGTSSPDAPAAPVAASPTARTHPGAASSDDRPMDVPPEASHASISGTVRDALTNAPIAGAQVCEEARCATSGLDGGYLLADEPTNEPLYVYAGADHRIPSESRALELADDEQRTIDFALLSGGAELTGTVATEDGFPIAGAHVRANSPYVITDADGAFHLWVSPGSTYVVAVAHGYVTTGMNAVAPGSTRIRLSPASTIAGIVVDDATGAPVANAAVDAFGGSEGHTRSDAAGRFLFEGLSPATYALTSVSPHRYALIDESVHLAKAQHLDGVVLREKLAPSLEADVAFGDAPCLHPSASLVADAMVLQHFQEAESHAGHVTFPAVAPGGYRVVVSCKQITLFALPRVEVADEDLHFTWTIKAPAMSTVSGRVTDDAGRPIPASVVTLESRTGPRFEVATDASGRYAITDVPVGAYRAYAIAREHALGDDNAVDVQATPKTLDFTLAPRHDEPVVEPAAPPRPEPTPRGALTVTVQSTSGASLDASIAIHSVGGSVDRAEVVRGGRVVFDALPEAEYVISASSGRLFASTRTTLTDTASVTLVVATGRVIGRVVDSSGTPVSGATAAFFVEATSYARAVPAGPDGRFELTNAPVGELEAAAYVGERATGFHRVVVPPDGTLDVGDLRLSP